MSMKEKEDPEYKASPTAKIESSGAHNRKCTVILLNGQEFQCSLEKNANGVQLLRQIRELLDIIEFDYFGLYFEDSAHQKYWLEGEKSIKKQLKNSPWKFFFSVKFYPSDPSQLYEDMTRYYMMLQLKDKIVSGSLPCSFVTHALLGSFVVQSELGDYDAVSMKGNYVSGFQFAPNQTNALEEKVIELHKTHKGLTPEAAEIAFLENVKKLPLYGVDQHAVKDSENIDLMLGVSWNGLRVYRDSVQINRFAWPRILKISYTRSKFHIQIRPVDDNIAESIVGFRLPNHKAAKRLWKSCVEHHTFFRLARPKVPRTKLMRTGSKFRYTGQTQHQTRQTVATSNRKNVPKIQRTNSRRTDRPSKLSSSDSQSPPELPKKEHIQSTVTTTEVVTITEEVVSEKGKEPVNPVTEDVWQLAASTEETIEPSNAVEESPKIKTSSSSSLSSMSDEGMDLATRHQKKVHKMKQENENEKTNNADVKFLEEPAPGSRGSSEWDVRLQSSPAKNDTDSSKKDVEENSPHGREEVTVVTTVTMTEVVEEVVSRREGEKEESSSSSEDEQQDEVDENKPAPLPDFVPAVEPESRKSSSSSSSSSSDAEEVEPEGEPDEDLKIVTTETVMVHKEYHVTEIVQQDPHTDENIVTEEQPESEEKEPQEETPARRDSTSSDSSSSESAEEELKNDEPELAEPAVEETNKNNNNNDGDVEQGEVEDIETPMQNVITTVETKSVRVEDVVIPREDNEVRKVALTADEDNNVTVTETRSSTSSSSSSSSSDSEAEEPETEEAAPVANGFNKPPIVETEVAYIEPTEEEKPAVTTEPPVVHTETKTITYESSQHQPDVIDTANDVQLLSSQTITAETMSTVTTTHITKTVVGNVSETRVEKSILITADGDADIHQAMAEAIKDTQDSNPDVNITKVVVHEEKVVENT